MLRDALADGQALLGDHGFPLGGLCGWVDYEGDFVFGDFTEDAGLLPPRPDMVGNRPLSDSLRDNHWAKQWKSGPFRGKHRTA